MACEVGVRACVPPSLHSVHQGSCLPLSVHLVIPSVSRKLSRRTSSWHERLSLFRGEPRRDCLRPSSPLTLPPPSPHTPPTNRPSHCTPPVPRPPLLPLQGNNSSRRHLERVASWLNLSLRKISLQFSILVW